MPNILSILYGVSELLKPTAKDSPPRVKLVINANGTTIIQW